ncbi:MAG TPA: 16S rRNA methyltransferase [Rhodobacteraceae bacterium]|jgi:16S rRNA (cytosine967-C5)-methyltransferase|nr:RsmB/NOP family class I SAM-dependent RNA methyltransferase [Paracoccaceae bacterium]HBG98192.1 16S rRNA methyltransferase [Paracoccaceae bacterium]
MTPAPRPSTPGLAARRAAARLLLAVLADGRALDPDAASLSRLDPPTRAQALGLARATLRGLGRADAVLDRFVRRRPPPPVRTLLRLGTVEIHGLGTPPHAAVDIAVTLARHGSGGDRHAGLVNAVLRRVAAAGAPAWAAAPPTRLPDWLRTPLIASDGPEAVAAIETAHEHRPPTDLTLRDPAEAAHRAAKLDAIVLPGGSLRLSGAPPITALPGFDEGRFWVQDAAAAIPVRWLAPDPGARVLDLCAAPGGKTLQLAAAGARVTALDLSASRIARLRANLARTALDAETVIGDARQAVPPGPWDAVLLDAPCSASGTIRRHPDLPHVKDAAALRPLIALQDTLIDRAVAALGPGGTLIYAVCSLLPEEGAARVAAALARHPDLVAQPVDPAAFDLPPEAAMAGMGLRTRPDFWPAQGGMDGFFMARLSRTGPA